MLDLQQGNCLKLMEDIPDKSIDLLLTDPPYNISKNNNFKTMKRSGIDFGGWDHKFDLISWLSGISRIMNDGSSIIIFNDWRNLGILDKKLESEGFIGKEIQRAVRIRRWLKAIEHIPNRIVQLFIGIFCVIIWMGRFSGYKDVMILYILQMQ